MSKAQPILCYRKGSATSFSVRKIGVPNTICRNYPAVGIAPPYLMDGLTPVLKAVAAKDIKTEDFGDTH